MEEVTVIDPKCYADTRDNLDERLVKICFGEPKNLGNVRRVGKDQSRHHE